MVVGAPGFEGAADLDPTKRFRDFMFLFSTISEAIAFAWVQTEFYSGACQWHVTFI